MAEIAAVLSVANAGFKLSITLFSFAAAVRAVDKEILRTAKDISLFSQVLKLLAATLERGRESDCISASAFETSAELVQECKRLFEELDGLVRKSTSKKKLVRMGPDDDVAEDSDKVVVPPMQQLIYFFSRKAKVETLRRNLESLKTSLQVMLSILNFAENVAAKETSNQPTSKDPNLRATLLAQERLEIESLILANEAAVAELRKHEKSNDKDFKIWSPKRDSSDDQNEKPKRATITSTGIVQELVRQDTVRRGTGQPSIGHYKYNPPEFYTDYSYTPIDLSGKKPPPTSLYQTDYIVTPPPAIPVPPPAIPMPLPAIPMLSPVPVIFPTLANNVEDSKGKAEAPVQDRADIINHLLALWSPKVGDLLPSEAIGAADEPSFEPGPKRVMTEESIDEAVELFPSRSRPY